MVLENDYEVVCTLGEGAFGKVYRAKHRETGEEVAAKEIKLGSASFEEACNSMELKALKALRHPCIVRLRELLRSQRDGSLFFIFEFIASDLSRLIKESPRGAAESQAIDLMRQLLVGLNHIHQHGFLHRDIKPANILLDPFRQTIRIADFGITRSLRVRPPYTDYVGTRWYRAPECLLRDVNYSSPVDVWAAGVVFAELLRGSPVFMGSSGIDHLHKIFAVLGVPSLADWPEFKQLSGAIRFHTDQGACGVQHVLPGVSLKVQAAVSGILTLNPKKRPPARRCLEQLEIFATLPPLDMHRMDSVCVSNSESTRLDKYHAQLPEPSGEAAVEITPPPSAARPPAFGIAGALHQDVDLDAELDDILADSVKPGSNTRTVGLPGNDIQQASITSLLNAFSLVPSSSPSNEAEARMGSIGETDPLLLSPPARSPASPSGGMDAFLASLEADMQ